MQRLVLLIILLTVVYSWEECKYVAVSIWSKLRNKKTNYQKNYGNDTLVADLVLVATIPLTLAYLILGTSNLPLKLLIILAEFIFLGLVLKGIEEYARRRHFTRDYQGVDKAIAIVFSLAGLVSPSMRFASSAIQSTTHTGKYLLTLAIPLASGLALAIAVRNLGMEEFVARMDTLIIIAVLGITLNLTIEILERMFRSNRLRLGSLMRVTLGIVLVFTLTQF